MIELLKRYCLNPKGIMIIAELVSDAIHQKTDLIMPEVKVLTNMLLGGRKNEVQTSDSSVSRIVHQTNIQTTDHLTIVYEIQTCRESGGQLA